MAFLKPQFQILMWFSSTLEKFENRFSNMSYQNIFYFLELKHP